MVIGERQRYGDLAIVLLAELATVLASDADRMLALFRKAGVVDDPRFDRPVALDRRQDWGASRLAETSGCGN